MPCAEAVSVLRRADVREAASLQQSLDAVRRLTTEACDPLRVAEAYLAGLVAAEQAWRDGGSPASLELVRGRMRELAALAARGTSAAELARVVLAAQAAAAQNEMAEMVLLFEQASALELQRRLAGADELPVVPVAEAQGESWLRLFRYRDAADAFARVRPIDRNPRVEAGERRARAAVEAAGR
jgi:hypothetical protein